MEIGQKLKFWLKKQIFKVYFFEIDGKEIDNFRTWKICVVLPTFTPNYYGQKCLSKIERLAQKQNFGQKSKLWSKVKFLVKNHNFGKNRNFGKKSKF